MVSATMFGEWLIDYVQIVAMLGTVAVTIWAVVKLYIYRKG